MPTDRAGLHAHNVPLAMLAPTQVRHLFSVRTPLSETVLKDILQQQAQSSAMLTSVHVLLGTTSILSHNRRRFNAQKVTRVHIVLLHR